MAPFDMPNAIRKSGNDCFNICPSHGFFFSFYAFLAPYPAITLQTTK
jgi:hypothetical protein